MQNGKVVYNAGIVHNIVVLAIQEVEGALPVQGKKNGISLYIEKDGIYADVSVVAKYGYNVPELSYRIQQSVKQNVENMTHYKVAEVSVHVRDVLFEEDTSLEKKEETVASEETKTNEKDD
jgi:uncharacterized alkaline shock family protein YloU